MNHFFLCSPDFKERLRDALVGETIVYVDKPENAPEILKEYPDWECWYTVAPAKGASRMAVKVEEYRKEHGYPGIEHLGDCLRAMVVCRRGEESGNLLHRTWKQLEQAFDIHEGHGRLKNNYATAGILEGPKHQKPPDMLMNAVLDVDGAMSMPAEIQVHHEEILDLKESKVHLLYEIARAKSIGILRGGAPAPAKAKPVVRMPQQPAVGGDQVQLTAQLEEMKKLLDAKDSLLDAKDSAIEEMKVKLRESSVEQRASLLPPVAAMVDGFMSSLRPFGTSALAAEDEERARQLFRMALAKQRSGWGMHQVPTEIGRATFIELIQQITFAENQAAGSQQQQPLPSAEAIGAVFDKADVDGSLTVSEGEFIDLFSELKSGELASFLENALSGVRGSAVNFSLEELTSRFVGSKAGSDQEAASEE